MKIIGIIAEYNPFHYGHLYQINKIKEKYKDCLIIAIVSSSFTQRGDISLLNKWDKTEICLKNGIDIVLELPFVFSTQSSDIFARGAIELLNKMNIDILAFGTESEDISYFKKVANLQNNDKRYDFLVKQNLNNGCNYATATNNAIFALTGIKIYKPNDLLALSYIKNTFLINKNIDFYNIVRNTEYHGTKIIDNITSASNIRMLFKNKKNIEKYIPFNSRKMYDVSLNDCFTYLKYQININCDNISKFQTVDEGIENRILKYINKSKDYNELVLKIKTKRYTYNKICRMLLHIMTNFTKEEALNLNIDYIRVLGFNKKGQKYLHDLKKIIDIPIVTGYKKNISKIFDIEFRISKIYSLIVNDDLIEKEYSIKPIMK